MMYNTCKIRLANTLLLSLSTLNIQMLWPGTCTILVVTGYR